MMSAAIAREHMLLVHYLKTGFRNLNRTRLFSLINILGLAVGLAACLLILNYVSYERSFDRFHPGSDRIYRLRYERTSEEGTSVRFASCCPPAADFIRGEYPQVEVIARIFRYPAVVSRQDTATEFTEERMYFVEPAFFQIFSLSYLEGDPLTGLQEPGSAMISESTARKYFGLQDPIGRTLTVDGKLNFKITGLFQDTPPNSHLQLDIVLAYSSLRDIFPPEVFQSWGHTGFFTYIRFKPGADPGRFEEQMVDLVAENCAEIMKNYRLVIELKLQRLADIHLTSHFLQEYEQNGSRDTVNMLAIAALFIILMAWVNYINLSTARALSRSREVALRKVVGSSRRQIILQLFTETVLLNLFSLIPALALVQALQPLFSRLTGIPASYNVWATGWFWSAVVTLFVMGILLSGSYPVAAISSFQPVKVLRGSWIRTPQGFNIRKALAVFQFVVALFLLSGAFAVYRQIHFLKSRDPGFDIQDIMVIDAPRVRDDSFPSRFNAFRDELLRRPSVLSLSCVTEVPGRQIFWDAGGIFRAGQDEGKGKNYMIVGIDYFFMDVFGLEPLKGRNFSKEFPSDEKALILNQTAVNWMGFSSSEKAVGQEVDYWGEIFTVIGVLPDYHQQSPKQAFEPTIFRLLPYGRGPRGKFALKISQKDIPDTIQLVEGRFKDMFPGNPFEFFFLEDYFSQQYQGDALLGQVIAIFSILAVFITSLGILGISSFLAVQRTKEIGIRKVLGASAASILKLFSRDFLVLIAAALFIAWPLIYWGVRKWLEDFALRMPLSWDIFLGPLLLLTAVTLITISANVFQAATADPTVSLKHE